MFNIFTYFQRSPDFTVWHSHPTQKSEVLITAGVDGDEYEAINLAQIIISSYDLDIPITVIPIVNLAGYQAKTSYNPLDGRYPKAIFPGNPLGGSSSRLMYEVSKYARGKKLWIDLHCGAIGETLSPFAWAPDLYPVLSYLDARVLIEKSVSKNLPYIMLEGAKLSWVYSLLKNLGKPRVPNWHPTYTKLSYTKNIGQKISKDILWYSKDIFVAAN
jgi:predicted deacylase